MKRFALLAFVLLCAINLLATTIYDIQFTTDPSGNSPLIGQVVTVQGIVTGNTFGGTKYFISSPEGGAWNGLYVYDFDNTPELGDEIQITGEISEYYGLTEITSISNFSVLSSNNPLPDPAIISNLELSVTLIYS